MQLRQAHATRDADIKACMDQISRDIVEMKAALVSQCDRRAHTQNVQETDHRAEQGKVRTCSTLLCSGKDTSG